MMDLTKTMDTDSGVSPAMDDVEMIGQAMARMRLMIGRRVIARLAIENVAPGLELSHLDVLSIVRRARAAGEVTVGAIADSMRIDPSRASRIVADMVSRNVLRREASQADARRIVVVPTALGDRLVAETQAIKMALIGDIIVDWTPADVEIFATLFDRFISGFERSYQSRDKASQQDSAST